MKKIFAIICVLFFATASSKAQYVNIPDSNFRAFLISKYPNCFNSAKMMDTTCSSINSLTSIFINGYGSSNKIKNLTGVQYFKKIKKLVCNNNALLFVPKLTISIDTIDLSNNQLTNLTFLPNSIRYLDCSFNPIAILDSLPNSIEYLECSRTDITSIIKLPTSLIYFSCYLNMLKNLPNLPLGLIGLNCPYNKLAFLPQLPSTLLYINCYNNILDSLPNLPLGLIGLDCSENRLVNLPKLPNTLQSLDCGENHLNSLPILPKILTILRCQNNNLSCLPQLPNSLQGVYFDYGYKISCVPNSPQNCFFSDSIGSVYPTLCNPSNNPNHCQAFPQIQAKMFVDNNSNSIKDGYDFYKKNIKVKFSNLNYAYTNNNGLFQISTDNIGKDTLLIIPPPFYTAVPATINFNFSSYDTLVNLPDIALQPNTLKDSLSIVATPLNFAARPGFKYAYKIQYENVGTTVLSPNLNFNFDNNLLTYDSSSNAAVANVGNSLSLVVGNLLPGQTGSFIAYFKVKTTAVLGASLLSVANMNAGNCNAVDSVTTIVRGSYDPNDKHATQTITPQDVVDGKFINYIIRFQNTGTDTAFNVVVTDTLSAYLKADNFQMIAVSHTCKTTIKDNVVYFEFLDINLPDSTTNKVASNGFVKFKVLPATTAVAGTIIPNKAYIYFDYNKSVITNIATTTIQNPLPLKLLVFGALPQDLDKVLIYWNTANEINTKYFVIEKSIDARTFISVAELAAKGSGSNSYSYNIGKTNIIYLRLKIVDKDGVIAYSNVIKINEEKGNGFEIVTNPAKDYLNIKISNATLNNSKAKLLNAQGLVVKTIILKQGLLTVDLANLPKGLYFLQTVLETKKVIVEK